MLKRKNVRYTITSHKLFLTDVEKVINFEKRDVFLVMPVNVAAGGDDVLFRATLTLVRTHTHPSRYLLPLSLHYIFF